MKSIILLIFILSSLIMQSQIDTTIVNGDTITKLQYDKNGQLMLNEVFVIGKDTHSFESYKWYYSNGNPKWIYYYNKDLDTSFYLSGRKNGTIDFQGITSKGKYERIRQNKKGELIERSTSKNSSKTNKVETFKNGQQKKTEFNQKYVYKDKYDTVYCYSGGITELNLIVIINDKIKLKDYDFNRRINIGGELYPDSKESNSYLKSRQKKHFYQEFTNDSILVYEGIFKKINLPVGWYNEYYPNGIIKIRGYYNKKGQMDGGWSYYNENGIFIQFDFYDKGIKKEQKTGANKG